jgi:hypothetical protein
MGNNKMKFKEYIIESKKQYLYHGQNYPGDPFKNMEKRIHEGNQQEGPGIYFGSYDVAKDYGKYVFKTTNEIESINFLNSKKTVYDYKGLYRKIPLFLKLLYKVDPEPVFYEISNWIEVYELKDVKDYHFEEMKKNLKDEQIRYFLSTYADLYKKDFLDVFNKVYPLYWGTYNPQLNFYAFLKPIKIERVKNEI